LEARFSIVVGILSLPNPAAPVHCRHQGQPGQDLGDGIKIVRFVVETDRGMCYAYFHPKWSVLFDMVAKGDPIAQVPTEMVVAHVQRATGQNLMDVLQR
jgi:hypothetical protein